LKDPSSNALRTMVSSAVVLSWLETAVELTPPTEEECRGLQEAWQEREQLLQKRDLLRAELLRLVSSATQSKEDVQNLVQERRWLLDALSSVDRSGSRSSQEFAADSFGQLDHLQMIDWRPISPGPEEVPWIRPASERSLHRSTNSGMAAHQVARVPAPLSAVSSIPGRLQQPGPEEIPWPQPRPQLAQRVRQTAPQMEAAPTPVANVMSSPTSGLEQGQDPLRCSRPSPPNQQQRPALQRPAVQPAEANVTIPPRAVPREVPQEANVASPTREVPCEAPNNNRRRRRGKNNRQRPVAPSQPPHPQVARTSDRSSGQAQGNERSQFSRNIPSRQTQGTQRLQTSSAQQPAAPSPAASAGVPNNSGTTVSTLRAFPTAAPAA